MKPSWKSDKVESFLNHINEQLGRGVRKAAIIMNFCINCKGDANEFKDKISKKEFSISGLCQKCQDKFFAPVCDFCQNIIEAEDCAPIEVKARISTDGSGEDVKYFACRDCYDKGFCTECLEYNWSYHTKGVCSKCNLSITVKYDEDGKLIN